MGKTVLVKQFVVGLRMDIQEKLTGVDGDLEHLLCRARFEEAKKRELSHDKEVSNTRANKTTIDRPPGRSWGAQVA